jgi:hypothetical protein
MARDNKLMASLLTPCLSESDSAGRALAGGKQKLRLLFPIPALKAQGSGRLGEPLVVPRLKQRGLVMETVLLNNNVHYK